MLSRVLASADTSAIQGPVDAAMIRPEEAGRPDHISRISVSVSSSSPLTGPMLNSLPSDVTWKLTWGMSTRACPG
jgi:hypothetical protein